MKKKISLFLVLFSLIAIPVSAAENNKSINLSLGYSGIFNPYLDEDVTFKMQFENKFGFDVGAEIKENLTFNSPCVFISPYFSLWYSRFFVSLGITFYDGWNNANTNPFQYVPFIKTGFDVGNIDIKKGFFTFKIGLEASVTPIFEKSDSTVGYILGSIIINALNICKPFVCVTWNIPL